MHDRGAYREWESLGRFAPRTQISEVRVGGKPDGRQNFGGVPSNKVTGCRGQIQRGQWRDGCGGLCI